MLVGHALALPLDSILLASDKISLANPYLLHSYPYDLDRVLLLFPKVNKRRNFFGSISMGLSRKQGVGHLRGIYFARETRKSENVFIKSMAMSLRPDCFLDAHWFDLWTVGIYQEGM